MFPRKYVFAFSKAHAGNRGSFKRENGPSGLFIKESKFGAGWKLNKARLLCSAEAGALRPPLCSGFAQGPPTRNTKWFAIFEGKRGTSLSCRRQGVWE